MMQVVQCLYEVGKIIYMCIDSVNFFEMVRKGVEVEIKFVYGDCYFKLIVYIMKSFNVQEVYEVICLIDFFVYSLCNGDFDEVCLYDLIWKCFIVFQMLLVDLERMMILIGNV